MVSFHFSFVFFRKICCQQFLIFSIIFIVIIIIRKCPFTTMVDHHHYSYDSGCLQSHIFMTKKKNDDNKSCKLKQISTRCEFSFFLFFCFMLKKMTYYLSGQLKLMMMMMIAKHLRCVFENGQKICPVFSIKY